jgi:hypothetical protein
MLVFAFIIEDSLRKVGRAGLNGVRANPEGLRKRLRQRPGQ